MRLASRFDGLSPRLASTMVALACAAGCNAIFGIEPPDPTTTPTKPTAADHLAWATASAPGSGMGRAIATGIAFDAQGDAFVSGAYYGTPSFGALPPLAENKAMTPVGFVASFDPKGAARASFALPVTGSMVPYSIAVDASGAAYVTGHFTGSITVGMQTETADPTYGDAFAMKIDTSGKPAWVRHFADPMGQTEDQTGLRVAVDSLDCAGAPGTSVVVLAGGGKQIQETTSATILGNPATPSLYVMRFGADGAYCAGKGFSAGEQENAYYADPLNVQFHQIDLHADLAIAPDHGVVVAGVLHDTSDLTKAGGNFMGAGGGDVFALRLGRALDFGWGKVFTGEGLGSANDDQWANAVAIDPSTGDVFVGGGFRSTLRFGATTLRAAHGDSMDAFVARLAASTGEPVWAKSFPASGDQQVLGLATDSAGDLGVAAYTTSGDGSSAIDFGGGPLTKQGGGADEDVIVARLDGSGGHVYSGRFGDSEVQVALGVASDAQRRFGFAGLARGSLGLGGVSSDGGAAFVALFGP